MSDLRQAAQQALEALEGGADSWQLVGPAIDALRAALAEPEGPPQRKPLSEDEALDIARTFGAQPWPPGSCVAFARAIERAHGIKE